MVHLLRSLFAGYFVAIAGGTIAVMNGYDPLSVVLSVWLSGSVLTVVIAASVTPLDDEAGLHVAPVTASARSGGPVHRGLTAKELALWDSDLAAETFEADLAADVAATVEADMPQNGARKTG